MIYQVQSFQGDETGLNAYLESLQNDGITIIDVIQNNANNYFIKYEKPITSADTGLWDKVKNVFKG